jgi:hypothetical protein
LFVVLFDDAEEGSKTVIGSSSTAHFVEDARQQRQNASKIKCVSINRGVKAAPPFAVFYILVCNIYCIIAVEKDD